MSNIRIPEEAELPQVENLISIGLQKCVTESDDIHDLLLKDIKNSLNWWCNNKTNAICLVYESNSEILGVILVKEFWNMSILFVLPKAQKQGVGKQLVSYAINECCCKSPKQKIMLNSSNFAAPFYKHMGFEQIGKIRDLPGGCIPFELKFEKCNESIT